MVKSSIFKYVQQNIKYITKYNDIYIYIRNLGYGEILYKIYKIHLYYC